MNKNSSLALILIMMTLSCQQVPTEKDSPTVNKTNVIDEKANTGLKASFSEFDDLPGKPSQNITENDKSNVDSFIKEKSIFDFVPYKPVEKYLVKLTQDGIPALLTGDKAPIYDRGLTQDGIPALFTKAENSDTPYIWSRKENSLLLDHFQLLDNVQKSWGFTTYATYSQIINANIKVSDAVTNDKNVELVKTIGFGLVKSSDKYQLQSVTPYVIRKTKREEMSYHIIGISFTSENKKIIIPNYRKLIPLPGISINKQMGGHKVRVEIEVKRPSFDTDIAALLSIKDRQYQLQKVAYNIYAADIELPVLTSPDSVIFELIDKASLEKKDEYNGYTFIFPVTE